MFKDKLNDTLKSLDKTQAWLSKITGIGKSSISLYCSGACVPQKERRIEIATALGLDPNYFERVKIEEVAPPQRKNDGIIPRLLPDEAAKLMGVCGETVRQGLREGVFPWGYAIKGSSKHWTYWINAKKFAEIERIEEALVLSV